MFKEVYFNQDARDRILKGVDILYKAVASTIGPRGRNVIIEQTGGNPIITNDGVTIAKSIRLRDQHENMGASLVSQAAAKTNETAGDGTTTATILASTMIISGSDLLKDERMNPVMMRKGMLDAGNKAVEILNSIAKPIQNSKEIAQIASISAADAEIGDLIAEAMDKVGKHGVVTMDESRGLETTLDLVDGMEFDKGYISPYFVTNHEKSTSELENAYVLVTSHKLESITQDILEVLEAVASTKSPILVIAPSVEGDLLSTLIGTHLNNQLRSVAVKPPGFGNRSNDYLQDIAVLTGAKFFDADLGHDFSGMTIDDLGKAERVVVTRKSTTIVSHNADATEMKNRISMLENLIQTSITEPDKEHYEQRLSKLTGAVAVIKIGAATESEMIERKLRIEDALNATKAAVKEGIVAGGGLTLSNIADELSMIASADVHSSNDYAMGWAIVIDALYMPMRHIILNAGYKPEDVFSNSNNLLGDKNFGLNTNTGEYVNLIDDGVIDPATVTKAAIQNAVSVASTFLTTDTSIIIQRDDVKPKENTNRPIGQPYQEV